MNISLPPELADYVRSSVKGLYGNTSEFFRELLRQRRQAEIEANVKALEAAHAGAYDRDTTPEELAAILDAQREVRAEMAVERRAGKRKGK